VGKKRKKRGGSKWGDMEISERLKAGRPYCHAIMRGGKGCKNRNEKKKGRKLGFTGEKRGGIHFSSGH